MTLHPYTVVRNVELFIKVMAELPVEFYQKEPEDKHMAYKPTKPTKPGGKKGGKKGC